MKNGIIIFFWNKIILIINQIKIKIKNKIIIIRIIRIISIMKVKKMKRDNSFQMARNPLIYDLKNENYDQIQYEEQKK